MFWLIKEYMYWLKLACETKLSLHVESSSKLESGSLKPRRLGVTLKIEDSQKIELNTQKIEYQFYSQKIEVNSPNIEASKDEGLMDCRVGSP